MDDASIKAEARRLGRYQWPAKREAASPVSFEAVKAADVPADATVATAPDVARPLDPAEPYYTWAEYKGKLMIMSECCADSFSVEEEIELRDYLNRKHPRPTDAAGGAS